MIQGPYGSGKTTLIGNTMRQLQDSGIRTAFIFNDDGTSVSIDAQWIEKYTTMRTLTAGCFGCQDEASFLETARALIGEEAYDIVLVEPMGFIAGHELPAVFKKQLGFDPSVFSLVDIENFEENLLIGSVVSQVEAATAGIGLTKCALGVLPEDESLSQVIEWIAARKSGVPVFVLYEDGSVPLSVIETVIRDAKERHAENHAHCTHAGCGHGHSHDHGHHSHEHHHAHDAVHGHYPYSFFLRDGVTFEDVRSAFDQHPSKVSIKRIKGTADGRQFDAVHDTWKQGSPSENMPFVTFYGQTPIATEFLDGIIAIEGTPDKKTTKEIVRSGSPAETETLLEKLLKTVPEKPLIGTGGPVTHPEVLELINELRKRKGLGKDIVARAITARVRYYVQTLATIEADPEWKSQHDKVRSLVIGIGWFIHNRPADLSEELTAQIKALPLQTYFLESFEAMRESDVIQDPEKRSVFLDETLSVQEYLRIRYPQQIEVLDAAGKHIRALHGQAIETTVH